MRWGNGADWLVIRGGGGNIGGGRVQCDVRWSPYLFRRLAVWWDTWHRVADKRNFYNFWYGNMEMWDNLEDLRLDAGKLPKKRSWKKCLGGYELDTLFQTIHPCCCHSAINSTAVLSLSIIICCCVKYLCSETTFLYFTWIFMF